VTVEIEGVKRRYRLHAKLTLGRVGFVLRAIADKPLSLSTLGVPDRFAKLMTTRSDGLMLVCGATGSGKSTTMASVLDNYIRNESGKVITFESPVEVIFPQGKSLVQQHEVGVQEEGGDIATFVDATISAMRESPHVVMFGELREIEALRKAVEVAETGHLVIGTLHTGNAVGSIERLIAAAPPGEAEGFRQKLASKLLGVLCQRLLRLDNGQRRANFELLLGTSAVAGAIVKGNPQAIPNILTTGTSEGMFTFAAHLADLLARKEITAPVAVMQSPNPRDTLDFLVQRNAVTPADANLLRKNYALV
jgi:twitching motility protein PilT